MTRKITTILLALALCMTLLPVGAGAAASSTSGVELKMDGGTLKYGDNNVETDNSATVTVCYDVRNEPISSAQFNGYVLNGGTYTLGDDVTIDKPLIIRGTEDNPTTLNLNGHVLKLNSSIYSGTATGSVIVVADSAYFVLQDSEPNREHHFTKNDSTGLYTLADDTTTNTITLTGGVITGGTGTKCSDNDFFGGGVFVGSKANFTMTGGNIVGCAVKGTTANGGGVFVAAGENYPGSQQNNVYTKFTMTGGSIVGCTAKDGGGVLVREHADFTMGSTDSTGNARIANCTATSGGGVHNNGTFTMVGSTIENCTASSSGGGVYSYGTLSLASGTIKNCPVGENAQGGSVHTDHGSVKNTSGTSSTIVYGEITHGDNSYRIQGKLVKFMNGETLYAETVAKDGGKISEPTPLPQKNGKDFDGWYSKNGNGTHYRKFDFTEDTVTTDNLTLYAAWVGDFEVEVSWADVGNGYYKSFADAWSGAQGEGCTFKILKSVTVTDLLTYSRKGATLDLNGKTLTANITITRQGTAADVYGLTVQDSGSGGKLDGTVAADGGKANLTVSGGTVDKVVAKNGGTLNCRGGTITNLDDTGGTVNHTGGTVNHTGGTASCTAKAVCTVCNTSYGELANHFGGTATCKDKAVCSTCSQPYGSKDPTNHAGTLGGYQHDKDGHWQVCGDCEGKVNEGEHTFGSDGKCVCGYEKPRRVYRGGTPTISAVLSHPDATSATNYTSGIYGLTFRSTASFASFRGVQVDGKTIASTNYIAEEGSIVVYLKAVYLQTLANGTHTVTILSTEGNATMDFTIGGIQSPKTADAGVAIYALMALTSYTGTALVVRGRKRK